MEGFPRVFGLIEAAPAHEVLRMTQVRRGERSRERARTSQRLWFLGLRRFLISFSIWSGAAFFFARGDGAAAAACFAARLRCTAPRERFLGAAARGLRFWLIMGTVPARTVLGRATLAKKVETRMGGGVAHMVRMRHSSVHCHGTF